MQSSAVLRAHFILYVANQDNSTRFYSEVLAQPPQLHVPGMTDFALPGGTILGLMPESSITALLSPHLGSPAAARGIARAELYLVVEEPKNFHARALAAGACELSPLLPRNWGHLASYCTDPDGQVIAFACEVK